MSYGDTGFPVRRAFLVATTVLAVHVAFFTRLSLFEVRPETLIVLSIVGGLELGTEAGVLLGVLAGFCNDMLTTSSVGIWVLICGTIGFGVGSFRDRTFADEKSRLQAVLTGVVTAFALAAYCALAYVFDEQPLPQPMDFLRVAVVAALWSLVLYFPLRFVLPRVVGSGR
jgi:rod shape-determining protein MreD